MSAFPSMLEYQETIQNPGSCFSEPELAGGTVVVDALGLPKPITGGFASVYQIKTKKKHFAVRCFLRSHAGVQERYTRISDFQRRHRPRWMAEFVYLAQGIKVRGQWYPVLKMEWVQGEQLNVYLDRIAGNHKAIKALSGKFDALLKAMQDLGIAHGDLQHGNILVAGGELKLIDYDAMYIPGMSGQSHEVGHRNFQHPKRSERDFGDHLDNFSAWVIQISLRALAARPQLWSELDGGDEGLLFRKEDFLKPDASKAFQSIENLTDPALKQDLAYLRACLNGDSAKVRSPLAPPAAATAPTAQSTLSPASPPTSTPASTIAATTTSAAPQATSSAPTSSFWSKAPSSAPSASLNNLKSVAAASPPSSGAPERLTPSVIPERTLLALAALAWSGLGFAFWQGRLAETAAATYAGGALAFLTIFYIVRFACLPQVRRRRGYQRELREVEAELGRSATRTAAMVDIETAFKAARRLDFDALFSQIASKEGRAVISRLMEYLEEQSLIKSNVLGVEPELSRRLARRGLKNALRLSDVIVSQSLADAAGGEFLTLVLPNGKAVTEPTLTRPVAEALLAWREALEKQFVRTAQGEEKLHQDALAGRIQTLETVIALHKDVNGWRFLGRILGWG